MNQRLAIAMWDFSWLVRRHGAEAEYAQWDRVLDELAERGYDCVRIDAFPHLVARRDQESFTVLPQRKRFMWGNHHPVEVNPRRGLVEFLTKLRERGIKAGLSSWFNDDATHQRATIVEADDYLRAWSETLAFLESEGMLDLVDWVDLCNEFPLGLWAPGVYRRVFGARWPNFLPLRRRWSDTQIGQLEEYLRVIDALRSRHRRLRYTWSYECLAADNVRRLSTSSLDLAEVHAWLSADAAFNLASGQVGSLAQLPGSLPVHRWLAPRIYDRFRETWLRRLEALLDEWVAWARPRQLPLYTSEAWAAVQYDDAPGSVDGREWDWIKDLCGHGVRMAVEKGWRGVCTSNFCQPHFPGMWRDVAWHRRLTDLIHKDPGGG